MSKGPTLMLADVKEWQFIVSLCSSAYPMTGISRFSGDWPRGLVDFDG